VLEYVVWTFGIFKVHQFPIWGSMASEVTRLMFTFKNGGGSLNPNVPNSNVYIDLAAAMSCTGRKQYHQVKKDGTPLCYAVTVTTFESKSGSNFVTAANNWTTRNAVKKTAIGWKRQLRHGGIKMSDLPTYAKRFRCALEEDALSNVGSGQGILKQLQPIGTNMYSALFKSYTDALGNPATYGTTNEVVMVPVGPDGAVVDYRMMLLGNSSSGYFGVTSEYLKSRRNIRDASDPTLEFPDPDNLLDPLFATAEELSDDIVDAVDDYNTQRPYDETASIEGRVAGATESTAVGIVQSTSFVAPLGLIKLTGLIEPDWESGEATYTPANDKADRFFIDVHAIYEM